MTGYDLKKSFDRSVRHFWPANQSQIYRTLAELDTEGLITKEVVEREDRLDMKIYHLAEPGRAELQRWLSTPLPQPDTREPFLMQIFFGGLVSEADLLKVVEHELKETEGRLAVFTALYQANLDHRPAPERQRAYFLGGLTLEYGLTAMGLQRRWLHSVVERIRAGAYTPALLDEILKRG